MEFNEGLRSRSSPLARVIQPDGGEKRLWRLPGGKFLVELRRAGALAMSAEVTQTEAESLYDRALEEEHPLDRITVDRGVAFPHAAEAGEIAASAGAPSSGGSATKKLEGESGPGPGDTRKMQEPPAAEGEGPEIELKGGLRESSEALLQITDADDVQVVLFRVPGRGYYEEVGTHAERMVLQSGTLVNEARARILWREASAGMEGPDNLDANMRPRNWVLHDSEAEAFPTGRRPLSELKDTERVSASGAVYDMETSRQLATMADGSGTLHRTMAGSYFVVSGDDDSLEGLTTLEAVAWYERARPDVGPDEAFPGVRVVGM